MLAQDLAFAAGPKALAATFIRAAHRLPGLTGGACYGWAGAAGAMWPIASHGWGADALPCLSLAEFDNPVVYSMTTGSVCQIGQVDRLVDIGDSFDALRERFGDRGALLVYPLFDEQRTALAAMALSGTDAALRAWWEDEVWQVLRRLHERLMATALARQGASEQARRQQVEQQGRDAAQMRSRARLLAAGFVGEGRVARRLREDMLRLADSSLSLLISGETGSGKDHAALLIHQASARDGKFVPVNCAAIPKELIEAELFGTARGAYTGATQARTGLVAEAHGGTLFLDEIGDMPLALQGSLLRVLNEKVYRPVGATREQPSDFRLICATHRALPDMVKDGRFREDLYFRIRQQVLHIPALRERPEDIPALVAHILLEHNRSSQAHVAGLSARAMALLQAYRFPGNVRELRSVVLAAAQDTPSGKTIRSNQLAELDDKRAVTAVKRSGQAALQELWHTSNLPDALVAFERLLLDDRLRRAAGSRKHAALSLGIPKRTLARKCQGWNLNGEES